jgi:hypothetical protein
MGELTETDRWLTAYAEEHGYAATFEPDWQAVFGRRFPTNPDFLVEHGGARAVIEARGFQSWALAEFMGESRGGVVPPEVTHRPIFYALKKKAEQLEPFAITGEPPLIALANTGTSDVSLDDHHVQAAMFGDLSISLPIPRPGQANADLQVQAKINPGYGAFCATDSTGAPRNPRPHVSGVAVLRRHDLAAEFRRDDLRRYLDEREPQSHDERLQAFVSWSETPIGRDEVDGPSGYEYAVTFYDLGGYGLGHGPPVPDDWFSATRDRRFRLRRERLLLRTRSRRS